MFYQPSRRHLQIAQAAAITNALPPFVSTVAVMVNPEPQYVQEIIGQTAISLLQFHGDESDAFCSSFGKPYIKAIRIAAQTDLPQQQSRYPRAAGILLDSDIADLYGGSGITFDWEKANYRGDKPIILAGGLTPENVQQALKTAHPFGVDSSSGVETDGVKDLDKIAAFCNAVRAFR